MTYFLIAVIVGLFLLNLFFLRIIAKYELNVRELEEDKYYKERTIKRLEERIEVLEWDAMERKSYISSSGIVARPLRPSGFYECTDTSITSTIEEELDED